MLYGTAWKKDQTTDLVVKAVLAGFRGIDTACQPKHYQENLVGAALAALTKSHNIPRRSIFVQTKFTPLGGQDPRRIPYDPQADLQDQVRQSFARSLENLNTDYVDSLVLHSPLNTHESTMRVWRVFEDLHDSKKVRQLGISNIYNPVALTKLFTDARVKPAVVQNRFYGDTDWDKDIRVFCREKGIVYQSFWTLTANPEILGSRVVQAIAERDGKTVEQVLYRFVMELGIVPLNGTTNEKHMREDLEVLDWKLGKEDVKKIAALIGESVD
ncbi:hypothetical protein HK102_004038 [Quaeritorhiza haematococci]|nr:hypothetical protein HK102_004038 [Quaeritorhiza haematococci]